MKRNILNEIEWYSRQTINSTFSQIAQELKKITDYNNMPTIKDLADSAYTTPSSITRFCNQIGYKGFKELANRLSYELEFISDNISKSKTHEHQSTDYVYNKQFEIVVRELNELSNESYHKIINVANSIIKYNKVYIIASGIIIDNFYQNLLNKGINVFLIKDLVSLRDLIKSNAISKNSCFLIFSMQTQYEWLDSILSEAKEHINKYYIFCDFRDWFEKGDYDNILFLSSNSTSKVNIYISAVICDYFIMQIIKMIEDKRV